VAAALMIFAAATEAWIWRGPERRSLNTSRTVVEQGIVICSRRSLEGALHWSGKHISSRASAQRSGYSKPLGGQRPPLQ